MDAPSTTIIQIQGKRPDQVELERLSSLPYGRTLPSGPEIKDGAKWFLIGTISGAALFFFGRWVIRGFAGPGVLFFGYGFAYLAAPVSVIFGFASLGKLLRSAQKTKPADALNWAWMVSILGDDEFGGRFGKLPYATSTMRRLLPEGMAYDESAFGRYVGALRSSMAAAADESESASDMKKGGRWHESDPSKTFTITRDEELHPDLRELSAVITYEDQLSRTDSRGQSEYMTVAKLELRITQCYIRSGKYWFPYDYMPRYGRTGQ